MLNFPLKQTLSEQRRSNRMADIVREVAVLTHQMRAKPSSRLHVIPDHRAEIKALKAEWIILRTHQILKGYERRHQQFDLETVIARATTDYDAPTHFLA